MNYPVVIHKEPRSDYGVSVPDLPGCISAGRTIDEALAMVREAIELHLEGLIEESGVIPLPSLLEKLKRDPEFEGGTWAIVSVDEMSLRVRFARIGVTMPQRVLDAIDRHAQQTGETRSGLLARAAVKYIGRDDGTLPQSKRGGAKLRAMRKRVSGRSTKRR